MLLRSSSTPVLGSLLSSFSESPNSNHFEVHNTTPINASTSIHYYRNGKLSYKHAAATAGTHNLTSLCSSSPISPSIGDIPRSSRADFRRAQSDGNLEGLVSASSNSVDELNFANQSSKRFVRKPHCSTLEAIPSFSFHKLRRRQEGEDSDQEEEDIEEEEFAKVTTNFLHDSLGMENLGHKGHRRHSYANVGSEEERGERYLARGLGISDAGFAVCNGGQSGGSGGGHGYRPVAFDGHGGDSHGLGIEEHYKRLLEENPCNPLCLRNYAQFLHQTKRDFRSAEEYYSRAILADPKDGGVLSQYANLVWQLYHDKDRAEDYYKRAIKASAEDSHVHAAYASFLWETGDEDQDEEPYESQAKHTLIREEVTA